MLIVGLHVLVDGTEILPGWGSAKHQNRNRGKPVTVGGSEHGVQLSDTPDLSKLSFQGLTKQELSHFPTLFQVKFTFMGYFCWRTGGLSHVPSFLSLCEGKSQTVRGKQSTWCMGKCISTQERFPCKQTLAKEHRPCRTRQFVHWEVLIVCCVAGRVFGFCWWLAE